MLRDSDNSYIIFHADHALPQSQAAKPAVHASEAVPTTDLKRRVLNFLATRNRPGLRNLDVQVEGGVVVIQGRVRSFYEKQLAHHCCTRVAGVTRVVDSIDVEPHVGNSAKN